MSDANRRGHYPDVDPQPSFPALERGVLEVWRRDRTFRASVERRPAGPDGSNEYVFYDGPPFANGLPHYGHLLTGYVKDIVPRYQTLRGRRVERRFGWDCHGLPAELEVEQEIGVSGRANIEAYGIERFNEHCRSTVLRYTEAWVECVTRQARWVDFADDYKTMDLDYMESVIWAFKQLWDKGLIYEGYKVVPYSWAAQTVVSNFETRMDDSYHERQDPAITVRFRLLPEGDEPPTDLLCWTTTPWTLPSNLALAVGDDIDYAVFERDGRRVMLGEATVEKYASDLQGAERLASIKGRELVGRAYEPLYLFFADTKNAFCVLGADFVDTEEGTGIVHMAPGFGEEDMAACDKADIPVVCPVDERGVFTSEVPDWEGELVFDANRSIIRDLRDRGALFKHETYLHNYPHCWRTGEPLIYRAMSCWYVNVRSIRERAVELNQQIHWVPGHVRDGLFGNWLANAIDWPVTRNRFWGSPVPVWISDDPAYPRAEAYGSVRELEEAFGVPVTDLHRPAIDALTRPNPDDPTGKSVMRRVPDVLDCWFESGSMPFAQVHYPFENEDWFDKHFPADFIVEYVAQTRGWFYTMMVLSTALFDRPPFQNCLCHGVVLDENGQKLSKSLRNYPNPEEIFEEYGADALRWFLVSSPVLRGSDLQIDREGQRIREVVRLVMKPIWNAYHFFCLYANTDEVVATPRAESEQPLDRYILAKAHDLVVEVGDSLDAYDIPSACARLSTFIDVLNNWYIRRSRDRFWKQERDAEKLQGYDTLYCVLLTLLRVASPLLPLLTDEIYRGLTGERSVHLSDWPDPATLPADPPLVAAMDRVRDVCSAGLALRRARDVRVRQPLRCLTVAGARAEELGPFVDLIRDEVNVKDVRLTGELAGLASFRLQVNARALGKRLGKKMQEVIGSAKAGQWRRVDDARVEVAGEVLGAGEFDLLLDAAEGVTCQPLATNDAIVILDLELDEALEHEGRARDIVRVVQQARREAELHVADRIHLILDPPAGWREAAERFRSYIAEQTLALELAVDDTADRPGFHTHEALISGESLRLALRKA